MELAIEYAVRALYLVMILSLPPIVVASAVGIVLSLIQAITQLQEQTLTFGVKLLAVGVTLFIMGGWGNTALQRRYLQPLLSDMNLSPLACLLLFSEISSVKRTDANIFGTNTRKLYA